MSDPSATPVLVAQGLGKRYESGPASTEVLTDVTFSVAPGETVAIVGASGSGKSTLLHLLGGLDTPTTGSVTLMGESLAALSDAARGDLRNRALGFVYQFHHLLAELTAVQNVALALRIRRTPVAVAEQKARQLLEIVGLGHRLQHLPSELSGGERQRVAIARALVTEPACVLADEPTGNLDLENGERVFDLLLQATRERNASLVLVTHDRQLAARCDRTLTLVKGQRPALWWLFAGITLFATMDAAAKWVGRTYPLTAAVWLRYLIPTLMVGGYLFATRGWKFAHTPNPRVQILRGLSLVTSTLCFWTALHHLPLVEAATVSFVGPTIVVIFSSFLLGERPRRAHWVACPSARPCPHRHRCRRRTGFRDLLFALSGADPQSVRR